MKQSSSDTYVVGDSTDLYAKRRKIYAKSVSGTFANLRVISMLVLLGIYYFLPWLQWGDRQAVLFDLPARKFHLFGLTFWPQDFVFLALLLIIAALALFFFTALAGRLWCGYACPQTVWTEAFMWMEQFVEGDRNARMKLDKSPWNFRKFRLKFTKHFLWIIFALFTGYTFVGYFTPIQELTFKIYALSTGPWETFWILFYSFATWGNAGKLREQVCIYMCPYARFQSAMFDKDTLIIAYDEERGEPRGPRKKGVDPEVLGLGDCIDCKMCVNVCPTGIDIREGLQYECIACAACIDACDEVMDKMGYPPNLIRYTTQHADEGKPTRVIRPRTIIYGVVFVGICLAFVLAIAFRNPLELDILKDRNRLYVTNGEGMIENIYKLRILNKDQLAHEYRVSVEGLPDLNLQAPARVRVAAGDVATVPVRVEADPGLLESASNQIIFSIEATDDSELAVTGKASFIGPALSRRRR